MSHTVASSFVSTCRTDSSLLRNPCLRNEYYECEVATNRYEPQLPGTHALCDGVASPTWSDGALLLAYIHAQARWHTSDTWNLSTLRYASNRCIHLHNTPQRQFITNLPYVGTSLSSWPDQMLMVCVVIVCGLTFKNIQTLAEKFGRPYNLPNQ